MNLNLKSKCEKVLFAVPCILTTTGAVSFAFADGSSSDLSQVTSSMVSVFSQVKSAGMTIMTSAIGMGLVFIGGKWLWGKTKQWLAKV